MQSRCRSIAQKRPPRSDSPQPRPTDHSPILSRLFRFCPILTGHKSTQGRLAGAPLIVIPLQMRQTLLSISSLL